MKRTITYHIWPRDLSFADKLPLIIEEATKRGFTLKKNAQYHSVTFNKYEEATTGEFDEFITAVRNTPRFEFLYMGRD